MSDKTYIKVGNGVARFENKWQFSIDLDKAEEYAFEYNGKRYVKLEAVKFKKKNKFGKDVVININEYKPKEEDTPF